MVNPAAHAWIKKGLEDAISAVLRRGKNRRGQEMLWGCLNKQLLKKFAETKGKSTETTKTQKAEYPCPNCIKGRKNNQMHTLIECFKLGNTCNLECRSCPCIPGTNNYPCHWRETCPTLRKREYNSSSRNSGFTRG